MVRGAGGRDIIKWVNGGMYLPQKVENPLCYMWTQCGASTLIVSSSDAAKKHYQTYRLSSAGLYIRGQWERIHSSIEGSGAITRVISTFFRNLCFNIFWYRGKFVLHSGYNNNISPTDW